MSEKDPKCNMAPARAASQTNHGTNFISLPSKDLADFLPLHDPSAVDLIKEMLLAESKPALVSELSLSHPPAASHPNQDLAVKEVAKRSDEFSQLQPEIPQAALDLAPQAQAAVAPTASDHTTYSSLS